MADEGVQILSYKGDPDLGTAGPGGVGFPGSSGKEFDALNTLNEHVLQQNFVWNQMQYAQAIKDRDARHQAIKDQAITTPLLDGDRAYLKDQFNTTKGLVMADGSITNDDKFTAMQDQLNKSAEDRANASSRYTEASVQRKIIASTADPLLQKEMMDHLDSEIKKGISHPIEPFRQNSSWQPDVVAPTLTDKDFVVKSQKTFTDPSDGFIKTTTVKAPSVDKILDWYNPEHIISTPTLPYQLDMQYKSIVSDPSVMNDKVFNTMNGKIDLINAGRGLTGQESNPRFVPHVAEKDENGIWQPASVLDFQKGWHVATLYNEKTETLRDAEAYKLNKEKAETGNINAEANLHKHQGNLYDAQASEALAKAKEADKSGDKTTAETEKIKYETATLKSKASQPVFEATKFFNDETKNETATNKYQPLSAITFKTSPSAPALLPGQKSPSATPASVTLTGAQLAQAADIPADWVAKDIEKKDLVASRMLANPGYGTAKGSEGKFVGWKTPTKILLFTSPDKDPSKSKLVGYDENGNVLKSVDASNGFENLIKFDTKYNGSKDMLDQINAGRQIINEGNGNTGSSTQTTSASSGAKTIARTITKGKDKYFKEGNDFYLMVGGTKKKILSKNEDGTYNTEE